MSGEDAGNATAFERLRRIALRPEIGSLIGLLVIYAFFAFTGGSVFTSLNGSASWLNIAAQLGIVAVPLGLLMIAGHFDLSIGSTIAGSGIVFAVVSGYYQLPTWIGILAGLLLGLLVGCLNGLLVTRTQVPSLIVTIATMLGVAGLTLGGARAITGGTNVTLNRSDFFTSLFATKFFDIFEVSILWLLLVVILAFWLLHRSPFGSWIYAVGGDESSARSLGIPTRRVLFLLYAGTGLGAAFVGVIQTSLYQGAQTNSGTSYIFNSITAVVIGGVLLTGGYGSVIGVVFGALTYAIVNQGIYFTGWPTDWSSLILGTLVLIAVVSNNGFRRLALQSSITGRSDERKAVEHV